MSVHSEPWPGIGLLVLVTLAATACSGAGSTVSAGPPATASARPTAAEPPVVISADVRTGEATVDISGTLEATLDLTAVVWPNVFSPPPGGMAITWRDLRGDLFGIGGRSFTGSRKTTGSLILSLAVKVKGGFVDLSSTTANAR